MGGNYKFDPELLSYTEENPRALKRILKFTLPVIFAAAGLALVLFISAISFVSSPRLRKLKRENEQLRLQYSIIAERVENVNRVLENMKKRDASIYKTIFEIDSVPFFSGADKKSGDISVSVEELNEKNNKKLSQVKSLWKEKKAKYEETYELLKKNEAMMRVIPTVPPVIINEIVRPAVAFGIKLDPFVKLPKLHKGIDFSAPVGTEVLATADGKVEKIVVGKEKGLYISIKHSKGYKTIYAQLSETKVKKNEKVKRGDVIALVGKSGKSITPHLHYEVLLNNKNLNPINYMFLDMNYPKYKETLSAIYFSNQALD